MSLANYYPPLSYCSMYYPQEMYFSVPFQSLYDGLLFMFEHYQFPFQIFFAQSSGGLSTHSQQLFSRCGVNITPPGKVIKQVALFLLNNQKQVDKALDILCLNTVYYPASPVAYWSLAEAYQAKGDKVNVLASYKKVLALKVTDERAKQRVQELTSPVRDKVSDFIDILSNAIDNAAS